MPQERFAITDFNRGVITRADAEDIPDNAAIDSNNIDGDAAEGVLQGIPASAVKSATLAVSSRLFEWIKTGDAKYNLVHIHHSTTSTIKVMTDFYNTTPVDAGISVATSATSMVAHNEEVHIANGNNGGSPPDEPNWTGYCNYGHFGGATLGWKSLSAVIPRPVFSAALSASTHYHVTATGTGSGTSPFDVTKRYDYNISLMYDGLQESPLGTEYVSVTASAGSYTSIAIVITLGEFAGLNPRITGVKLYRREVDVNTGDATLWRLQQEMTITAVVGYVDRALANQSWANVSTTDKYISYSDNNSDVLSSYEEQTGLAETLTSNDVYYTLNTDLNGFHFVAACLKTGLPDASMMMFRSKQYRYDMFDWTNDYLKLPTSPTALKAFSGKIWAFDENHLYRINPDGMYIEDSTEGIGCLSQRSIVITDYGMFWCDAKNAYWHDGEKIIPIGDAIKTDYVADTAHWSGFTSDYTVGQQSLTPIVTFHAPKNYVLFIVADYGGTASNVWAFHVQKKRWDKWTTFTTSPVSTVGFGAFSGRSGEVYVSDGTNLVNPFGGGATKRAFYWTSKILDFGQPFRLKRFYEINAERTALTATPAITYDKDRAGSFASFSAIQQAKLFQVKITEATAYNNVVYSLEILFRRLAEL